MADDLTIQAGVRTGGGATPNVGEGMPPSRTNDALQSLAGFTKFAGNLLAPLIEREKNAAWVDGVTAVMAGRTTEEVAKDNPAWARLFGDNYAVQGARMQEAASHGTRFLTRVTQQMPELRKLSQNEFSRFVADQMEKDLPTDPQAAMLAKQRIVQSLPEVSGQWARANVQWQQEDALIKHTEAVGAAVGLLKTGEEAKRLNPAVMDPAMDDLGWAQFQAAMTVPPGVDPKVHDKIMHQQLVGAMGTPGGVALYRTMRDRGMFDTLPQDVQDRALTNARQSARTDVATRMFQQHPELVAETAALRAEAYKYPVEELIAKASDLNARSEKIMGVPQELWQQLSTAEMETVLRGRDAKLLAIADAAERQRQSRAEAEVRRRERLAETDQRRRERAREKAEDKAAAMEDMLTGLQAALQDPTPGGFGSHMKTTATPKKVRDALNSRVLAELDVTGVQPGSPEWEQKQTAMAQYLTKLVGPNGYEPPASVENITRLALASSSYTPQVQRAVDLMSRIKDPSTRARLISGDQNRTMAAYQGLVQQNTTTDAMGNRTFKGDRDTLWLQAQAQAARPPKVSGGDKGQEIATELREAAGFDTPIMDGLLKREYDERHDLPEEQRRQAAVAAVQSKAYSADGTVVLLADSSINPNAGFSKFGGMPPKAQAAGMKPLLAAWGVRFNASAPPTVYRALDVDGVAQFIAVYDTPTGTQAQRFTGAQVRVSENDIRNPKPDPAAPQQGGVPLRSRF
jgi:hypothetical protein